MDRWQGYQQCYRFPKLVVYVFFSLAFISLKLVLVTPHHLITDLDVIWLAVDVKNQCQLRNFGGSFLQAIQTDGHGILSSLKVEGFSEHSVFAVAAMNFMVTHRTVKIEYYKQSRLFKILQLIYSDYLGRYVQESEMMFGCATLQVDIFVEKCSVDAIN